MPSRLRKGGAIPGGARWHPRPAIARTRVRALGGALDELLLNLAAVGGVRRQALRAVQHFLAEFAELVFQD